MITFISYLWASAFISFFFSLSSSAHIYLYLFFFSLFLFRLKKIRVRIENFRISVFNIIDICVQIQLLILRKFFYEIVYQKYLNFLNM